MNRVIRDLTLALAAVLPIGAVLAVAIAPAYSKAPNGSAVVAVRDVRPDMLTGLDYSAPSASPTKDRPTKESPSGKPTKTTESPKPTKTTESPTPATKSPTALPVTGGDSDPGVLWLVAGGLLAAGGGLLLLGRRLRQRLES